MSTPNRTFAAALDVVNSAGIGTPIVTATAPMVLRNSRRSVMSAILLRVGPELSIEGPALGHDDAGKGLDVGSAGVEVHDAGAQHVAPADDRVGDEEPRRRAAGASSSAVFRSFEVLLDRARRIRGAQSAGT